jgi:hypothetical protein
MTSSVYIFADRNFASVYDEWQDRGIMEANARLIAAAPDLLEALKKLLTECKYMMENGDMMDNRVEISIAKAAIAKAEGKA